MYFFEITSLGNMSVFQTFGFGFCIFLNFLHFSCGTSALHLLRHIPSNAHYPRFACKHVVIVSSSPFLFPISHHLNSPTHLQLIRCPTRVPHRRQFRTITTLREYRDRFRVRPSAARRSATSPIQRRHRYAGACWEDACGRGNGDVEGSCWEQWYRGDRGHFV